MRSLAIAGQTWQRGALCVARTVSVVFFFPYKKVSLLVEALSQIATARTTATLTTTILIIARIETQENTNEPFKYAKYITRICRKKKESGKENDWGGGIKRSGQGER